jgi:short-subunit dehydrogenase
MNVILITGASGGIGEAVVNRLAENKKDLLLVARNGEKLSLQCIQIADKFGINVQFISADLSKPNAAEYIFSETQKHGLQIEMLINNAGVGSAGEFSALSLKTQLDLIQLNIASLVALTHLFLPQMQERKSGTIINIASLAAFFPVPYMSVYAASKVFVRSFTEAVAEECKPYDIHIMLFCPGLTRTNFNNAAGIDNDIGKGLSADYETTSFQTPEQVAHELIKALDKRSRFAISGSMNRFSASLLALIPTSFIARNVAKMYRKRVKM